MNRLSYAKSNRAALFFAMALLPTGLVYSQSIKKDTTMKEKTIDEVVVIGYGKQKKADLTSAISTLSPKDVLKAPGGVTDALQGTVAGVNVSGGKVRIRGTASITGSTDPLWVVDGIIGGSIPNEDEIESIQILKDAASAAIYGVRGSNGVILVTTKKGRRGEMKINFNTYLGVGQAAKKIKMLNAHDYGVYVNELYYNSSDADAIANGTWNQIVPTHDAVPSNPLSNTDWWDQYFGTTIYKKYNLSMGGQTDLGNYRFGISHDDNDNTLDTYKWKSENLFANFQGTKGRFTYGGRIQAGISNVDQKSGASLMNLLMLPSNLPVYNSDGSLFLTGINELDGNDLSNQVWFLKNQREKNRSINVLASVFAEFEIFKWLKYKLTYTRTAYRNNDAEIIPQYNLGASRQNYNYQEVSKGGNDRQITESLFSYDKSFGDHSFSGVFGTITETYNSWSTTTNGQSNEESDFAVMTLYPDNQTVRGDKSENAYFSYLARLMYNYKSKYLFTANFRADESSKFAKGKRWGYFPSFSLGWNVTKEPWMEKSADWLNSLKIRATLGWIGSAGAAGNYDYQSVVTTNNLYYTFGTGQTSPNASDSNAGAPLPETLANKDLTWETTRDAGIGADIDLFKNKLSISLDYYNRKVTDMLVNVQLPGSSGTVNSVYMNIGSMVNKGFEFAATYRQNFNDFKMTISPNFSTYSNKVLSLGSLSALAGGSISTGANVTRTVAGRSVAEFWGYKTDGLFKSDAEAASSGQENAKAGDLKYVDLNGDGKITDDDKTYLGSSIPDFSLGLNLTFEYKNWDFSALFQGDFGNKIYNNWKSDLMGGYAAKNQLSDMNNRYRAEAVTFTTYGGEVITLPANTNTNIPRAVLNDPNNNHINASDYFIEDGTYVRLNRVTLGYTFDKETSKQLHIDNLRMYIGAKNPLTFSNYSMFDPQVPNNGSTLNRGVDGNVYYSTDTYWSQREFFWGLQLTF
ncbi:SusC/RagA family TonB-linked outer membrane protein [Daejeonia sp. YH14]|uniref:SusC/RagA family TonB-linked outer membrane protein n=1 Tax=Daejeonia sp. YH14 TaxID=3439042 RepID=UPI003F490879